MARRGQITNVRNITIQEILKINKNRRIWIESDLAKRRVKEKNELGVDEKGSRALHEKRKLLKAIKALEMQLGRPKSSYYKMRAYDILLLFKGMSYPSNAFKIEENGSQFEYMSEDRGKSIKKRRI